MLEVKDKMSSFSPEADIAETQRKDESLVPGYRESADVPSDESVDEILADVRRIIDKGISPPAEKSTGPPDSELPTDDRTLLRALSTQVKSLSDEVADLKAQVEKLAFNLAPYPRGEPEMASVEENHELNTAETKAKKSTKARVLSIVGNIVFYVCIVAIIVGAFLLRSASDGRPFMIAGYSSATILTSSMEDTYPKGSLIISQKVDSSELQKGDDITFMINESTTVTHRIVEVIPDYAETGKPAYVTKGTMNKDIDKWDPVAYDNVVGKVIYCSAFLGSFAAFIKGNWPLLIFMVAVIFILIFVLKRIFREDTAEEKSSPKKAKRLKEPDNSCVSTDQK